MLTLNNCANLTATLRLVAACLLLLMCLSTTGSVYGQANLKQATNTLRNRDALAHGTLGVAVIDVSTGSIIESFNSTTSLIPASLLKVTTTATALSVLGGEFRWETQLCYSGQIIDNELRGDLIIVGSGDPSLGGGRPNNALSLDGLLTRWVDAVANAGIKSISGKVIGDDSLDPGAEPSPYWQWNDIGNYYGAGVGALMIHENQYTLKLQRTAQVGGQPTIVGYDPNPGELRWTNELRSGTTGSGDQSYIFGAPGTYDRVIRGSIPAGKGIYEVEGSLPDPAFHAADWLTEALEKRGISVANGAVSDHIGSSPQSPVLDTYQSPPLRELIELTNFKSVNIFAEAIYAELGRRLNATSSPSAIGEAIVEYWEKQGFDTDGWEQVDGSGLSMRNMITPLQLAQVLQRASSIGLKESLPQVGEEGTVRGLLRGNAAASRIRAKSGTLKRSRGFCGYATTASGRELAFVVIANNYTGSGSQLRRQMGMWMAKLVE